MDTYQSAMAPRFESRLAQRLTELRQTVRDEDATARTNEPGSVTDTKDLADIQSQGAVDDAQAAHAAQELDDVLAALGRLADGTYGACLACGEPIDLRRLEALPAARYCTACQRLREHHKPAL